MNLATKLFKAKEEDGRLFFVNTYTQSNLNGYTDIYSDSGFLLGNIQYVQNKAEGDFNIYDQDGNIIMCEKYKHDELIAPCN